MTRVMRRALGLALGWLLVAGASLTAQNADFTRLAPAFERKLRDPNAVNRADALEELRRFPTAKAVPLVLLGTRDGDVRVRQAAMQTLVQMQTDAGARAWMLKAVGKDTADDFGPLVVALLAGADGADELLASLDKLFKTNPARMAAMFGPAEELAAWSDPAAVRALSRLTELHAFPTTRGLQRAVVKSLIAVRDRTAVRGLIEILARIDGELRYQVLEHLRRATGQPLGAQPLAWEEWWVKNEETYRYPVKLPPAPRVEEDGASYYGLPIRARRIAFVIDNSGSMVGKRLADAKKELLQALSKLPAETEFNIVVFNTKVWTWSARLVPATDDAKRKATVFVSNLVGGGNTSTYDALQTAMALKVETIYLLTDGEPTSGQVVKPPAIAAAIGKQNVLPSITIHTIGLSPGPDTSVFSRFLQVLADQNHGQYRKVD